MQTERIPTATFAPPTIPRWTNIFVVVCAFLVPFAAVLGFSIGMWIGRYSVPHGVVQASPVVKAADVADPQERVTRANFAKLDLDAGMSLADIEKILGPSKEEGRDYKNNVPYIYVHWRSRDGRCQIFGTLSSPGPFSLIEKRIVGD